MRAFRSGFLLVDVVEVAAEKPPLERPLSRTESNLDGVSDLTLSEGTGLL